MREYGAGERGGAEEVQVHQVAKFAVSGLLDGADLSAAGVVDQYVDPPVPEDHFGDDGGDAGRVGDVEGDGYDAAGVRGGEFVEGFGAADGGHYGVTGGEGRPRDRLPETGVGAGDQPDLAGC